MLRMMSRMARSSPPGVSRRRTTNEASAAAASSRERMTKSALAGPIAPCKSTSQTSCAFSGALASSSTSSSQRFVKQLPEELLWQNKADIK